MPRILFVAMSNSIHTARWINQLAGQGWDIHLFPSIDAGEVHPELKGITIHHSFYARHGQGSVRFRGISTILNYGAGAGRIILRKISPDYRIKQLKRVIEHFHPDVIHSMETQAAGYLTLDAKKSFRGRFPVWIHTVWGSDIYLFGPLKEHREKIKYVLKSCDYYTCECQRDIKLARIFGFKGEVLLASSAEGGFDLQASLKLRPVGPVSDRRIIMLKGYQGWAGRALVGLRALERCADLLEGYEIVIYAAAPEVVIAAELFTESTGIPTIIIPNGTPHQEILSLHGKARLSIGLSISDGLPSSFLEALVMGSFPIQSNTSCADEWIVDGKTGILVPPNDPEIIEVAIRRALTDDDLVNQASERNFKLATEKLDQSILKLKAIEMYQRVFKRHCKLD
jgi:glycosyltransferase involved in cell wall biosynthesis